MKGAVDAHHHLWDLSAVHYPWLMARGVRRFFGDPAPIQRDYLVPEFRAAAQAEGVTASVHVQVGAADPLAEARWVDARARENPGFPAAQVAFCDLTAPDAEAALDALQALPTVRGVRQILGRAPAEDPADGPLGHPRLRARLRSLAARGLSFDLQLTPEQMEAAAQVFAGAPELDVVLCHAGSPRELDAAGLARWAAGLGRLAALPNLSCKLSGLAMFARPFTTAAIRPVVATCLELFGPDRLMWGSNFPVDSLGTDYAGAFRTCRDLLPPAARPAVFGATARRVYRLADAAPA